MSNTIDDTDSHMAMNTTSSNTPTPDHDRDFDDPLDPIDSSPGTPPLQSQSQPQSQSQSQSQFQSQPQPLFPPPPTTAQQTTQTTPHMSSATLSPQGLETPPPSAMRLAYSQQVLLTPGPTGTPPSSQLQLQRETSMGQLERKSLAEDWVAAGWGGKKLVEEYELQKDKLLDGALDLSFLGDDYNESDMWN